LHVFTTVGFSQWWQKERCLMIEMAWILLKILSSSYGDTKLITIVSP